MGQNSQEVAYGFGQFGSAITDGAGAIYPPKGYVIVAITALADSTLHAALGLTSEVMYDTTGALQSPYIDTDVAAHNTGNVEDADAHNDNGSDDAFHITLASAALNIKIGMIVEHATMCPRSLTDPYKVTAVNGVDITLNKLVAANYATGSTAQTAQFYDEHGQGYGGLEMDGSDSLPKGITIYGRWTNVKLSGAGAGRLICYFGK